MVSAKINVMAFATMIGMSFNSMPYVNHKVIPMVKIIYIKREIPLVF